MNLMPTAAAPTASALQAYLPRPLIARCALAGAGASAVWSEWLAGSLMHCDISGFTAMSERLARRGNEGGELMAGILNRFFERMLGIAGEWGGLQMKFGGDAMLLYFGGDAHTQHAVAAALRMQRAMAAFATVEAGGERHALRMRIGVHSGRFFTASVGDPSGQLHYVISGRDVNRAAAVEARAPAGGVAVTDEVRQSLGGARCVPLGEGCWRVVRAPDAEPPDPLPVVVASPRLAAYLMPPFARAIAAGAAHHAPAEHRLITAVFINVLGVSELIEHDADTALEELDGYVRRVIAEADVHGGYLAASDASDDGDKLIVLFGAPVAAEQAELNALRFALAVNGAMVQAASSLRHRIGIATGYAFAGEIGSPSRREYTVIGDTVNLSARLMAAAPVGAVYLDAATAPRAIERFRLRALPALSVKGKQDAVRAFALEGERDEVPPVAAAEGVFVGRETELSALRGLCATAAARGRWAFVSGAAGIGKSRLLAEVAVAQRSAGWMTVRGAAVAHRSRTVFALWPEPLRALFGLEHAMDPQAAWERLREELARLVPDRAVFAPLVADVLSLPSEPEPMLAFLEARQRRELLVATLRAVLQRKAAERRLLLVLEDVHLADTASLELLGEIIRHAPRGLVVLVSARDRLPAAIDTASPHLTIELAPLTNDDAASLLSAGGVPHEAIEAIAQRGQGNPLFLQELALARDTGSGLPRTVNEVIVARADQLEPELRRVLRHAAIAGVSFAADHVAILLGLQSGDALRAQFAALGRRQFIQASTAEGATHAFAHGLAQEVLYEAIPFAERRSLHGRLGLALEREGDGRTLKEAPGLLLYHFERAADWPRTVRYAAIAGDRAAAVFANQDAIDYYGRALQSLDAANAGAGDRSALLERIADCLAVEGRHAAASQALLDALECWRTRGRARRTLVPRSHHDSARDAVLCRKLATTFERQSEYDESLAWLDRALALLPRRGGRIAAEVYAAKSMTLFRKGQYRDAIEWGRRAVAIAQRARDRRAIAYAHNMVANAHLERGSIARAMRHLRLAIAIYEEVGDVYGIAAANNNLGNCYQARGANDDALRHYMVALDANTRVGNDAAITRSNIGEVLVALGRIDEAREHLTHVLRSYERDPGLAALAGFTHVNLARCAMRRDELAPAAAHLDEAMRLLESVGASALLDEARIEHGHLRLLLGDPQAALAAGEAALNGAASDEAGLLQSPAERLIGLALAALGRREEAREHVLASIARAREADAPHEEARGILALARFERQAADGRVPRRQLRHAIAMLTPLGASPELDEARALLSGE